MSVVVDEPLVGARVLLRAPRIADAQPLFTSVTSDPKVTEFLSWTPHADVSETRRVITDLFNVGQDRTWVVVLRDTDEIIGQLGYRRPRAHEAELGYCMGTHWWGHGLMSEAVKVALHRLHRDAQLERVTAAVHLNNTRSVRLLERCGFTLTGTLPRHTVFPNLGPEPLDCLLYERAMR